MSRLSLAGRAARVALLLVAALASPLRAQRLLVPMDDDQQDHLKAYGLTYNALKDGLTGEWLLNYRGGSFLLPDTPELRTMVREELINRELLSQEASRRDCRESQSKPESRDGCHGGEADRHGDTTNQPSRRQSNDEAPFKPRHQKARHHGERVAEKHFVRVPRGQLRPAAV